jgi:hypothetical protein
MGHKGLCRSHIMSLSPPPQVPYKKEFGVLPFVQSKVNSRTLVDYSIRYVNQIDFALLLL